MSRPIWPRPNTGAASAIIAPLGRQYALAIYGGRKSSFRPFRQRCFYRHPKLSHGAMIFARRRNLLSPKQCVSIAGGLGEQAPPKSGALRGVPAKGVDAYRPMADSGAGGAAPSTRLFLRPESHLAEFHRRRIGIADFNAAI